ncbi:MAG: hypothetical protein WCF18_06505 [Chthoniobacteraceae bacterium]
MEDDPFSWLICITGIFAAVSFVWSRQLGGRYFPASMILLTLAALCGLVLALLLVSHPDYFKDDQAIPWIETVGLGSLVFGGAFLLSSIALLAVVAVAAIARARQPKQHQ